MWTRRVSDITKLPFHDLMSRSMIDALGGPRLRRGDQARIGGVLGELGFELEHVQRL